MGISLDPRHLKRYGQIAALMAKYGRSDLVRQAGLEASLSDVAAVTDGEGTKAEGLAADLEAMGPTFIKLGQLLSSRVDLLPAAYTDALSRLQERVEPPTFQPNATIRRHAADLMQRRMLKSASPSNVLASLLETNEFVQRLPGRLNRALDSMTEREFEVKVRVANDALLLDGLQKIANRIAAGAILAALIVGASMLMQVETTFTLMGYPGLAILLFLAAAVGGIMLLFDVAAHDRWVKHSRPPPTE